MRNAPSLKQIKRIPLITLILLSFYFLLTLFMCFENIGGSVSIEAELVYGDKFVSTKVGKEGNLFTSGRVGRLAWKIKNFKEAVLVNLANTDEMFSLFDLLYMFSINLVLFITVKKMTEETIYSNDAINGFKLILYLIVLAPLYNFITNMISGYILKDLTHNQVTSPLKAFGALKVWIGIFFVQIIPLIFKKGKSLQQEQDLTI
ncbi:MAG: hypothetical protein EOP00_14560 [Pedobacter sp.]|nr:MAG: hypothetical protein EOP00_14560 [Pedobacter sp.]